MPDSQHDATPVRSAIYELCDRFTERSAELDPNEATMAGLTGHDTEMTDYSPSGHEARAALARETLDQLRETEARTARDRIAAVYLAERLETALAFHDAGEDLRTLNILGSPVRMVRHVFDVMPHSDAAEWEHVAVRMEKVPEGLAGFKASLTEAAVRGLRPARRQALACARQAETWAGVAGRGTGAADGAGYFSSLVGGHRDAGALHERLEHAADSASAAYAETARWLREEIAPSATPTDPVGPERYELFAREFLGTTIDVDEIYEWGWDEVRRIDDEMRAAASEISPGASIAEVVELLASDPSRSVQGEDAIRSFLQELMERTISDLDGAQFDIPGPLKTVEQMIAAPGGAAAPYYTPPSEDFSRPGRVWYPTLGNTVFPLWGEITTCYHEAVPGHHLQLGQVMSLRDELTRFQRTTFLSGHGEGWALYAERLMDELGKFERPDYRLGYLRSQLMRSIRVVVDIGMHLERAITPTERFHPGERWTPELGQAFLFERSHFPRDFMASELDRYLGLPAQAISYKVGERAWLAARSAAREAAGSGFDLKSFHARALGLGPLGLDQLIVECGRVPERPAD